MSQRILLISILMMYSEAPKTECSVWETKRFCVWLSNLRISDVRFIFLALSETVLYILKKFKYKTARLLRKIEPNQPNQPNIRNRTSEIGTI